MVPFDQNKVKGSVQMRRFRFGHRLRVHCLNQVRSAQMDQVPAVGLDQPLLELRQGEAREARLPLGSSAIGER